VNAAAEANIYNDPEAAAIVFKAGWPSLTMVGSDIGERTLFTPRQLEQLQSARGPQSDFIAAIAKYLLGLAQEFGDTGTPMYDPLAVAVKDVAFDRTSAVGDGFAGVALDPSIVTTQAMHVDVETRGEFTRATSSRAWIPSNPMPRSASGSTPAAS
jgi:inosine-uridine nucleoside N-ribohydrolase